MSPISNGPPTPDRLTIGEIAALIEVKPESVMRYRWRGTMPPPDGKLGSTPWWFRWTIEQWVKRRPGSGDRTLGPATGNLPRRSIGEAPPRRVAD